MVLENDRLVDLLAETAQGNRQAFDRLYQITSGQLYAICLRMLNRKELAEEVLQESFVKVWHNADTYQESLGTVMSWMITIVRYRALDMIRYQKVRKENDWLESAGSDDSLDELLSAEGPSNHGVNDPDDNQLLDRCMGQLDLNQRQAIHLAYFKGLTHSEIVTHMSAALGTVKSWIRRGLSSLERCLTI